MTVKVKVYKDRKNKWRWQMKVDNGRIVGASTEGYSKRRLALENLEVVTGLLIYIVRRTRGDVERRYEYLGLRHNPGHT